jgi:hypothetical protein
MQRVEHVLGNASLALDPIPGAVKQGNEVSRPPDQLAGSQLAIRGAWLI